jgi:hypothetical protein
MANPLELVWWLGLSRVERARPEVPLGHCVQTGLLEYSPSLGHFPAPILARSRSATEFARIVRCDAFHSMLNN